ncbi:amidase [Paraburkholderia caballeronis]|uniref:Aspartyl-tRNA(Asn)/glutamyl-tRNA(Gln) amidotransferase subunit A n=1 Tax=Paraburkholderia caballeronis TaxID=416943 RepID=A0A1H7FG00_9BURK|nr:amidase [Paraburkholderia caballeronis]PXW24997.1 aspartyl-tRNA(Asn)/glutamyl-tRNA(Gln) amidotransferase subunit A [Paraburkholderia caballeronis]PXX00727.1 aspartyl-tRNA(Asn)/glutamyl-tRNA(Gln) amidotransferase subunit A [Paraburkholderia caballeronis]RAJ98790.1 aspartyl-tRNA(Asn)/glutamyl-tRNA(Gln) amidotransferase subunit A [Paraburkholderia caballeronis]SEE72691.1 aspartyl-tRNA(Asn)/glutamyl-tRNA(Gln) amidotransferase subunit A [Paraburkholderia caballeronis]SEK24981.1 aspartyl-tRNA(Asn
MRTIHTIPTIRATGDALARGDTTSAALTEAGIAAIDDDLAQRRATYTAADPAAARHAAATSDSLRARGYAPSPLAGVPLSIKDLFDVKGQTTTAGSRVLREAAAAPRDGVAIARLREAGAVLAARTNMSEFAFSGLGTNPHYGTPANPLDPARLAGGSSSGAAVSVALGHVAGALGTDTGGSLRIPAAFCGLVGFKPTARRVPLDGVLPLATSFDTVGPIARSVDCCALIDAIVSGATLDSAARPLDGLRFGVTPDYVGDDLDATVRVAFERALGLLRDAGATIEYFAFPELADTARDTPLAGITAAEAWAWHRPHVARAAADYDPRVLQRLKTGEQRSAADYLDLLAARRRLAHAARMRLAKFDAWLMPTVAIAPPLIVDVERDDARFFALNAKALRNTAVVNFIDGCAISVPCHRDGELPVGLSVCRLALDDARVLSIGRSVEALLRGLG